jgi:DNA-binding beta-propeller fold protein YncE
MYTIDPTSGVLTQNMPPTATTGNGPTSVAVDPSSKFAFVVNRSDDTVSMFTIDPNTGNLTPNTPALVSTGATPFTILVDPSGKFVYVSDEGGAVTAYTLNTNGTLTGGGGPITAAPALALAITGKTQ